MNHCFIILIVLLFASAYKLHVFFPKDIETLIKDIFSDKRNFEKGEDVAVFDDDSTKSLNKCDFDAGLGDMSQQLGNGLLVSQPYARFFLKTINVEL
jgi:hypothetical protein